MSSERVGQNDLEHLLEDGRAWVKRIIQKSNLITEQEIGEDLFYQRRALKSGPIFSVLIREDKETLVDLSTSDFPKVIISDGQRALHEETYLWAERGHGLGRARRIVGGLPVYGFEFRPYQLQEDGSIEIQIHAPHLDALFALEDRKLRFKSSSSGLRVPYLVYCWAVDQEGGVVDEEVSVDLGIEEGKMVFIVDDEGVFKYHHQARKPMRERLTRFNDFTREELEAVLDPFNLGGINFLFKKRLW